MLPMNGMGINPMMLAALQQRQQGPQIPDPTGKAMANMTAPMANMQPPQGPQMPQSFMQQMGGGTNMLGLLSMMKGSRSSLPPIGNIPLNNYASMAGYSDPYAWLQNATALGQPSGLLPGAFG